MQAFIHQQIFRDGDWHDRVGTEGCYVSPHYQSLGNLKQYFLRRLPPGRYHVEAFKSWDNRYGKPDFDFVYTVDTTNPTALNNSA